MPLLPLLAQHLLTQTSGANKDTTHGSCSFGHRDTDDDAASHQAKGHTGQLQAAKVSAADGDVHAGLPRAPSPASGACFRKSPGGLDLLRRLLVGALPSGWEFLGSKKLAGNPWIYLQLYPTALLGAPTSP